MTFMYRVFGPTGTVHYAVVITKPEEGEHIGDVKLLTEIEFANRMLRERFAA